MDSPGDWTATALFSPSKARAQQAQAKDWASVDAWLGKKYGKRIPTFERREETLQALLTLATANEGADEQRSSIDKVEKQTLHTSPKRTPEDEGLYQELLEGLDPQAAEYLGSLSESFAALGASNILEAASKVCSLQDDQFTASEQIKRAESQYNNLRQEHSRLRNILHALQNGDFTAPTDLPQQTSEWARNAKHLRAKLAEYDERLSAIRNASGVSSLLESVSTKSRENQKQRMEFRGREVELSAFDSLPSDPRAARAELDEARANLRRLTARRDALFEDMLANQ
ncbi:hypothetical protein KC332_g1557 [Hortaea werneckii]|uniref:Uncharacterized protein n=2 Tax=Hortaea werneckii TaxID=91943 RepID=A0A3M7IBA9_HORWE|nr:hypothetical protein KC358_g1542 [Hortaea werneckii]OTA24601.1 hypothetical protein BTJ68_10531 [Hortaea werneckii EXF-2000]KAI6851210.1 hypothetical protein KC350_g1707 [Hortaea werneckii]KAI6904641.1 hypothetical protein KC348_g15263 [Hortaea werneckii]KAI6938379.1 hypothetical protein KC341_g4935 [Hortaea werneckii]